MAGSNGIVGVHSSGSLDAIPWGLSLSDDLTFDDLRAIIQSVEYPKINHATFRFSASIGSTCFIIDGYRRRDRRASRDFGDDDGAG